ncbi:MAG: hypothetical protein HFG20_05385 [Anaerotruncus sp.]|nr:hypothetical protein [Anaerotruncus sp.]
MGETQPANSELSTITSLLEQLQKESQQQTIYRKKQLFLTRVCALLFAGLLAAALYGGLLLKTRVEALATQADSIMVDLKKVSNEISESDISGMFQRIDQLAVKGEQSITEALLDVEEALEVLTSIDIQSMNSAIHDLQTVTGSLSRLFGR